MLSLDEKLKAIDDFRDAYSDETTRHFPNGAEGFPDFYEIDRLMLADACGLLLEYRKELIKNAKRSHSKAKADR